LSTSARWRIIDHGINDPTTAVIRADGGRRLVVETGVRATPRRITRLLINAGRGLPLATTSPQMMARLAGSAKKP